MKMDILKYEIDEEGQEFIKAIETVLTALENSIPRQVIENKLQLAEKEVEKIREQNIKYNNATKYDYLEVGKRDAYKELLERK